jgi:bis(5'-nucleosyl)-tetraphosphatase (symmetrical)
MASGNLFLIGDVQGCFDSLLSLLDKLHFNATRDRLILCGDLVNRGPKSREVLDFCMRNSDSVRVVLGNHDVYLLGRLFNVTKKKSDDTLDEIVAHPNAAVYRDWLRSQPLIIREGENFVVHAGFHPDWSLDEWIPKARRLSQTLRSNDALDFLKAFFTKRVQVLPDTGATLWEHQIFDLRCMTSIRAIRTEDRSLTEYTDELEKVPGDESVWFESERIRKLPEAMHIFFGHWAALGHYESNNVSCLDSGCVWGRQLTAVRASDRAVFQVDAQERT